MYELPVVTGSENAKDTTYGKHCERNHVGLSRGMCDFIDYGGQSVRESQTGRV